MFRSQVEQTIDFGVDRLVFNTAILDDAMTVDQSGLVTESSINVMVQLDGGKRKRKKKVYTKPKKVKHVHKKRSLALLEYYNSRLQAKSRNSRMSAPSARLLPIWLTTPIDSLAESAVTCCTVSLPRVRDFQSPRTRNPKLLLPLLLTLRRRPVVKRSEKSCRFFYQGWSFILSRLR